MKTRRLKHSLAIGPYLVAVLFCLLTCPLLGADAVRDRIGWYPGYASYSLTNLNDGETHLGVQYLHVNQNISSRHMDKFNADSLQIFNTFNAYGQTSLHRLTVHLITPIGSYYTDVQETALLIDGDTEVNGTINQTGVDDRKRVFQDIANGDGNGATVAGVTYNYAWDSKYKQLVDNIVASGQTQTVLRLGHEFDGVGFPHSVRGGNHEDYKDAFRHIVTLMRDYLQTEYGMTATEAWDFLKFEFCFTGNGHRENPSTPGLSYAESAYPGDDYVDFVSLDFYDTREWDIGSGGGSPAQSDQILVKLDHLVNFAYTHGKPYGIAEWGLWDGLSYPDKPGDDNPGYIQNMHDWLKAQPTSGSVHLAYHIYYNGMPGDRHDILNGDVPNSKAAYQQLFGAVNTDEIRGIHMYPIQTGTSGTYTLEVDYNASQERDIWVEFKTETGSGWYGCTKKRVSQGSDRVQVDFNMQGSPPASDGSYRWVIRIVPVGGTYLDAIQTTSIADISVVDTAIADRIVSVDYPTVVRRRGSYEIQVEYEAQVARDITVELKTETGHGWYGTKRVTVPAGRGMHAIEFNLGNYLPPEDAETYRWVVRIMPEGGTYVDAIQTLSIPDVSVNNPYVLVNP